MIVIGPANNILDETYLVSTESRGYIQEPGESPITLPTPPPTTTTLNPTPPSPNKKDLNPTGLLPDLIPAGPRDSTSPRPVVFLSASNPHTGREDIVVDMTTQGLTISDLVHPSLSEPLRNQQQTSFKLVKLVSDFNHQLSKIHEQFAEDTAQLVETFRKRTSDTLNQGPHCSNSIAMSWDQWMAEVMQDSACHTEIASSLGRAVARTLLEKTFHMKIQSRKVFAQRETYERLLATAEDSLSKCHSEYRQSWTRHVEQQSPASLATYLERHNTYAQQIHATNGMLDQYFAECLPHLLQELDDVYHDVSGVVVDSLIDGSTTLALKTANMTGRWSKTTDVVRKISAQQDIDMFIESVHLPDYVPVTRHTFAPPPPKEVTNEIGLPIKTSEVVLDRVVSETARVRYENLRTEVKDMEANIKLLNDGLETLIRIQAKNLDQQLYNKANEIQEEIGRKRCDLRVSQIQLAGLRAQKELFSSKVINDAEVKGAVEGVPAGGSRERKHSTSSTGNIKNKWVKAFKSIKGKAETDKPKAPPVSTTPQIIENSHIFQEYTYKKITPCDVCSQILRGHSRQGLKCKLCRMNVHPDCQEKVVKCQPKSKLLRRQKSASEFDSRTGMMDPDAEDETGFASARASVEPVAVTAGGALEPPPLPVIRDPIATANLVLDSGGAVAAAVGGGNGGTGGGSSSSGAPGLAGKTTKLLMVRDSRDSLEPSPTRRRMGGSYSKYTPGNSALHQGRIALQTDGDLVDSSGRRIKQGCYANTNGNSEEVQALGTGPMPTEAASLQGLSGIAGQLRHP